MLKKPDSLQSLSPSDKTKMEVPKETLKDNLILNIDNRLKTIDIIALYNEILDEIIEIPQKKLIYDLAYMYSTKCHHKGMFEHYGNIMMSTKEIRESNFNRYLCLDLIAYIINIDFERKRSSNSNMYL